MSDGKYALTPSEAALTTTRGGNPLFDHPTLWLGGAQPAKSDPDHGVIREMSAKWGEGPKEKPLDFSGDIGLWQRKIAEGPEGTARRMAVFEALAKLKAHLRAAGARTYEALWRAVGNICELFEPKECWNFFRHAGYVAT